MVDDRTEFQRALLKIAVPVTLQSLLQSSFSVVDQVMTGQLGSVCIAGIGLAARFGSLYQVLIAAVAAAAGILLAQYSGREDAQEAGRSFSVHLALGILLAGIFLAAGFFFPEQVMGIYTEDALTRDAAAGYLRILSLSFLPLAVSTMCATLLRCRKAAVLALYSGMLSAFLNTGLNYVLIFGRCGVPAMGARGAALATLLARLCDCVTVVYLFIRLKRREDLALPFRLRMDRKTGKLYAGILLPILVCEFFWSLGENVYGAIYGHLGTESCAAMTLTAPVQVLMTGAMSGIAQASGILVGGALGRREEERAFKDSRRLLCTGLAGSVILSLLLAICSERCVMIYPVEESVRMVTRELLLVYAAVAPVKVMNMILGGGILRSGGRTEYVMAIDLVGTWIFGVPLGLVSAFVLGLPITQVYFLLSLEEGVRLALSFAVFRRKCWMRSLRVRP